MEEISMTHVDLITEQQQVKAETLSALSHCSRISSVPGVTWHMYSRSGAGQCSRLKPPPHERERERTWSRWVSGLRRSEACTVSQLISAEPCAAVCPEVIYMSFSQTHAVKRQSFSYRKRSDDIMLHCTDFCPITRFENECPAPCIQPANRKWLITVKKGFLCPVTSSPEWTLKTFMLQ